MIASIRAVAHGPTTQGLVKHRDGYLDEFDMPGVLINCQCEYRYVYDLADVPDEALTAKGKAAA